MSTATKTTTHGPARACAATGRVLAPGDRAVAALTSDGAGYTRTDTAADAWAGPPPGCVAYWPCRVPAGPTRKPAAYPDALLADWFYHLAGSDDPGKLNLRYVVALLLMRRRRLKFEDSTPAGESPGVLVVRDAKTGARHEVRDPRLTDDELAAVQAEIGRVLGWG